MNQPQPVTTLKAEVSVALRYRLAEDWQFLVPDTYGSARRMVRLDQLNVAANGDRVVITGSGRRLNKDGTVGSLRASQVHVPLSALPFQIACRAQWDYVTALGNTPEVIVLTDAAAPASMGG